MNNEEAGDSEDDQGVEEFKQDLTGKTHKPKSKSKKKNKKSSRK